jgi:HEAT repeat protein
LIELLDHEDKGVRTSVLRGLSTLGAEAPEKELIKVLLQDNEWEVRSLAAKALGPIKNSLSSRALFRALNDRQWWVRQNAANALIGHPGADDLFILAADTGDKYCIDSIVSVLENVGKNDLADSIKKLKDY